MAYKKNFFKDKTIITLSAISVVAAVALIAGMALDSKDTNNTESTDEIVDLNDEQTHYYSDENETTAPLEEITKYEPQTEPPSVAEIPSETPVADISVNAPADALNFTQNSLLTWPVDGNIVIDYDMENTIYFPTLDIYKCSDSICIQSDIGTPVYASAKCVVKEVGTNEEIGTFVVVDLGNEYLLKYGQLKDIAISLNDTLKEGDLIGYVNEPSRYYTLEGPNLLLNLTKNGVPVNPLDYLNYE